jgi:hypothetical protein
MGKNKRSKRKHLNEDMRKRGFDFVSKNYQNLSVGFYKKNLTKIIASNEPIYRLRKLSEIVALKKFPEAVLQLIIKQYEIEMKTALSYPGYNHRNIESSFWIRFQQNQVFSERFFMENADKLDIRCVNTELNPWALPENQSEELKVLLMLRN